MRNRLVLLLLIVVVVALASLSAADARRSTVNENAVTKRGLLQAEPTPTNATVDDDHDDDHDHDHEEVTSSAEHDDHDHEEENEGAVTSLKIMSIVVLCVVSLLVSGAVIFLPKCACFSQGSSDVVMSLATAFSGGVFLCVGVTHLLGEATDILLVAYGQEKHERFRPAQCIAILGYLLMLLIQKVIFRGTHSHGTKALEEDEMPECHDPHHDCEHVEVVVADPQSTGSDDATPTKLTVVAMPTVGSVAKGGDADAARRRSKRTTVVATMAALMIHSLMEGLSLGMQESTHGTVLIFIAIVTHEWAEDLAIASATSRSDFSTPVRCLISAVLSCTCSVGIAIGWGIKASIPKEGVGYFLAASAGTFIFVACTEIVSEIFADHSHSATRLSPFANFSAFLLGAGAIYAILAGAYSEAAHHHGG